MTTKRAPFLHTGATSFGIMRDVLIALVPVSGMAVVQFGWRAILFIVSGIGSAVLFEYLFQRFTHRDSTIHDGSAAVTTPLWILVFSTFVAIVPVKQMAGGIGRNHVNPAVFARVLLKILFTPWITGWVMPGPDAVSTATPLEFIGNGQKTVAAGAPDIEALFLGRLAGIWEKW